MGEIIFTQFYFGFSILFDFKVEKYMSVKCKEHMVNIDQYENKNDV